MDLVVVVGDDQSRLDTQHLDRLDPKRPGSDLFHDYRPQVLSLRRSAEQLITKLAPETGA